MATASHSSAERSSGNQQGRLHCVVVTPEATVLDHRCEFVAVPLYDGELGVQPQHAPLIARLGRGELRCWSKAEDEPIRHYIEGGFVQIAKNVVSVVTTRATAAESLQMEKLTEQLKELEKQQPQTVAERVVRAQSEARIRAQMRIVEKLPHRLRAMPEEPERIKGS